jgi:hypothetical protein
MPNTGHRDVAVLLLESPDNAVIYKKMKILNIE